MKRLPSNGDFTLATCGLAIILFLLLAPQMALFAPWMPNATADPSWCWATNEAVAKGLAFGKQFIFQTGPYSAIYNGSYHPATYALMLGSGLFLASVFALNLITLRRENGFVSFLAALIVTLTILAQGDAKFYFLTLLVSLTTIRAAIRNPQSAIQCIILAYNWTALPLISFVKGSFCIHVLASILICLVCLAIHKRWRLLAVSLCTLLFSSAIFWLLAGQQLANLPGYYRSVFTISSGYTQAMSGPSMFWQAAGHLWKGWLLFTTAAALALAVLPFLNKRFSTAALCRWLLLALFLFMSFKAGFIRHDGHATIASVALFLLAFAIPLVHPIHGHKRQALAAVLTATCLTASWIILPSGWKTWDNFFALQRIAGGYSSLAANLKNPAALSKQFVQNRQKLRTEMPLPVLPGSADIYSYNQGYLFASENIWNPRPIIQSYSAYDKNLLTINRDHLLGDHAPDSIFFAVQPIDNRLPALEDGASWPVLWSHYHLSGQIGDFLILRKKAASASFAPRPLAEISGAMRQTVDISDSSRPLLAEVAVKPTLFGKVLNILFKSPELAIVLETSDGSIHEHRFIAGIAETPFLLSPYVADTKDFAKIISLIQNITPNSQAIDAFSTVKRFWINAAGGQWADWCWHKDINIKLFALDTPALVASQPPRPPLPAEAVDSLEKLGNAVGFIDKLSVEDAGPSLRISIKGWAIDERTKQSPAAAFFLKVGNARYFLSLGKERPNLAALGEPHYLRSGFDGTIFLNDLPDGDHKITIEVINQAKTGVYELERFSSKKLKPGVILRKKDGMAELIFNKTMAQ